jgi:hypothetical protein
MAKNKKAPRRTTSQTLFAVFAVLIIVVMLLSTVASLFY